MLEMATCASALDFSSSRWSNLEQMGPSRVGVLARESCVYTGVGDPYDYECVLVEKDVVSESHMNSPEEALMPGAGGRFSLVMGNEYDTVEGFSHKPRPNEQVRVSIVDAMSSRLTEEASDRISRIEGSFEDTVLTLLRLVRPIIHG